MSEEPSIFAALFAKYSAKMDATGVMTVLKVSRSDVKRLTAKKHLKPLGKPKHNSVKWYATRYIADCAMDIDWLNKAQTILQQHNNKRTEERDKCG